MLSRSNDEIRALLRAQEFASIHVWPLANVPKAFEWCAGCGDQQAAITEVEANLLILAGAKRHDKKPDPWPPGMKP